MSTHETPTSKTPVNTEEARKRLERAEGRAVWRNLDELASTDELGHMTRREYPSLVGKWEDVDRRDFLKVMGASMALGGLTACTKQPIERIVPYVEPPEEAIPGKSLHYASIFTLSGYAQGVLVESHLGRPTKVEGNPKHPASLGATDVYSQASVLDLYDPDRPQAPMRRGKPSSWQTVSADLDQQLETQGGKEGAGLRLLTGTITSPTLGAQIKALLEKYPKAKWHQYEPVNRDSAREGAKLAFGRYVDTVYDLTKAELIVSLDADFLINSPAFARYARDFASRRRPDEHLNGMNRLYAVESMPTVTGTMADHKQPMRASDVENFARGLARAVGLKVDGPDPIEGQDELMLAAADDLKRYGKHSLVIPGEQQPPVVHAIAHMINHKLGSDGTTSKHIQPVEVEPTNMGESIQALAEAMNAGEVDLLVMLEVNPVFNAPADLGFAAALENVADRIHLGSHYDETAEHAHWYIPATHYLESWGDARAYDGTASIVQPLIQPLYGGSRSSIDVLAAMLGRAGTPAYDIVREHWEEAGIGSDFESAWRRALHEGVIPKTASKKTGVYVKKDLPAPSAAVEGLELVLRPDPSVYDGRFANNAWLQELPRPVSKITWENAAILSPATGKALGIKNKADDVTLLTLARGDKKIQVPALMLPGHADDSITLHLGYGRRFGGSVAGGEGNVVGVDPYPLRTREQPWVVQGVEAKSRKIMVTLATTQHHPTVQESMAPGVKDRHAVRVGPIDELRKHPDHPAFAHVGHDPAPETTFYEGYDYSKGNKWGMVIDLNTCIGCNACTIACQAENNIPTVGKEEVLKGRELHWIRLDRYWEGTEENPATYHQPLPCMHCENAPCETVCPVGATVHSAEGLNQMVYNRCVGTRYCSNNCPYKVRRFNFFGYADHKSEHAKFQRNPNVTVRSRGVMEKCTYCVQRINAARIESKKDGNRPIKDGEVLAACQQACPAGSIVFGNLNDPESKIAAEVQSPLNYGLLTELNVLPRTTYQAKITNPNPVLSGAPAADPSEPKPEEATGSHHG